MIRIDTGELAALSVDLGRTGARAVPVLNAVFADAARDLEEAWRANARTTSGAHGKHYPDSIDSERLVSSDIAYEIGPNPSKPQGGMAFETGSVNQPAHLSGQMAADEMVPQLERRVSAALGILGL